MEQIKCCDTCEYIRNIRSRFGGQRCIKIYTRFHKDPACGLDPKKDYCCKYVRKNKSDYHIAYDLIKDYTGVAQVKDMARLAEAIVKKYISKERLKDFVSEFTTLSSASVIEFINNEQKIQ